MNTNNRISNIAKGCIVVALGFLCMVSSTQAAVIALWKFDGTGTGLTDDSSGNGHTLANSGVTYDAGNAPVGGGTGSALFNGSSILNTVATLDLTSYTQLTIDWYMLPTMSTSTTLGIVWEQSANYNLNPGAVIATVGNTANAVQTVQKTPASILYSAGPAPGGTVTGAWHHYTMTLNTTSLAATTIKLAIDGVSQGTSTGAGAATISDVFFIGARSGGTFSFSGNIDELSITGVVPEPAPVAMLLFSGLGAAYFARKRKN
ncbi:MAG: LamG-like jellyroll fold domain-containing protein [Phycisphaerae bacterium]|jgi:hypothetical protein